MKKISNLVKILIAAAVIATGCGGQKEESETFCKYPKEDSWESFGFIVKSYRDGHFVEYRDEDNDGFADYQRIGTNLLNSEINEGMSRDQEYKLPTRFYKMEDLEKILDIRSK